MTVLDMEKIASDYLRDATSLRVVGRPPSSTSGSWVQVRLLDAANDPLSRPEWLLNYLVQFDCYASEAGSDGSQQKEANELAIAVRESLDAMPGETVEAVVTSVRFAGMAHIPDDTFEPARERVSLSALIWAHP